MSPLYQHAVVVVLALAAPALADPMPNPADCPDVLRGVQLNVREIRGGVVLELVTQTPDEAPPVQRYVREAAAYIEYQSRLAAANSQEVYSRDGHRIPAVDISVKNWPAGVRVTVRADAPQDAPAVVAAARGIETAWYDNTCIDGGGRFTTTAARRGDPRSARAARR